MKNHAWRVADFVGLSNHGIFPYLLSDITGRGIAFIGQALARNKALEHLDLSGNPLGDGIG